MASNNTAAQGVGAAIKDVQQRITAAKDRAGSSKQPTLVAISKTKPSEMLQEAYDLGHRVFGENYLQELQEKHRQLPNDIEWHFVGHVQSKKSRQLVEVPGLAMVETVDSVKLADKLDNAVEAVGRKPLPVLVQVNTSGEESKFGVEPADALSLAQHINDKCSHLRFRGLMTIGMADYSSRPENFKCLTEVRSKVAKQLNIEEGTLELSMGMSNDFEQAIEMGSTNVRVGSTIFGARNYDNK